MKLNLKNKKTIIISALAIATILVATASTITLPQKIKQMMSKKTEALLAQDYLEVNRNDSPKFSVTYNDERTKATITIDYPLNATEKQYSIDGGRVWKNYEGEFILNQNVTIYARYKTESTSDYIIGSTKLIIDLKYSLELQAPIVEMNTKDESEQTIQYTGDKITKADVDLNLSHPQEDDAKIEYEAKISSYYIGTEGLIDADGKVNEAAVLAEPDNEGASFKKIEDYKGEFGYEVAEDNKQLTIKQTGIYKVTIRAISNGGFVKSEEINVVVAIDKINRADLIMLKTADGENYASGTWTNQNITAYINPDAKEAYEEFDQAQKAGNAKVIFTDNDGVESEVELENFIANGKTFTEEGEVTISFETQIGAVTLTIQQFKICIDKTAPEMPEIEILGGDKIVIDEADGTQTTYYTGATGLKTYRKANGTSYPTDGYYEISNSVRMLVNKGKDNLSGVEEVKFKRSENEIIPLFTDHYEKADNPEYAGKPYEYNVTFLATFSFSIDVELYAYDKAGNMSKHIVPIKVDKTAPQVELKVKGGEPINGWYPGQTGITQNGNILKEKAVQAYLEWSDSQTGIDDSKTELMLNDTKWTVYHDLGDANPPAMTMKYSGTYKLEYIVYDKAGNSTKVAKTVNICLAHSASDWKNDGIYHWKVCSKCGTIVVAKTAHSGGTWINNTAGSTHYKICTTCKKGYGYSAHTLPSTYSIASATYHTRKCTLCSYVEQKEHYYGPYGTNRTCSNCGYSKI